MHGKSQWLAAAITQRVLIPSNIQDQANSSEVAHPGLTDTQGAMAG